MAAAIGNQYAAKERRWASAINKALEKRSKAQGQKDLVALAEVMLSAAENGESWALKELGDRLDGKAAQSHTIGGDENNPLRTVSEVLITPLMKDESDSTDT